MEEHKRESIDTDVGNALLNAARGWGLLTKGFNLSGLRATCIPIVAKAALGSVGLEFVKV